MMPRDTSADLDRIEDEASTWLVRRDAGFTAEEAAAFDAWLTADPRHLDAFAEMEAGLDLLTHPREVGTAKRVLAQINLEPARRRSWWRAQAVWIAAGAAAAVAVILWVGISGGGFLHKQPTVAVVQPERRVLPDGSVVELKPGAEILVDYQSARRDVTLLRGEAHFDVAKNPDRPFVVAIGPVRVRAVGTAFAIRRESEEVEVLVTEGTVSVSPGRGSLASGSPAGTEAVSTAAGPAPTENNAEGVILHAGHRTVVRLDQAEAGSVDPVSSDEMRQELAWRIPRFELSQAPLEEALERFNRSSQVKLVIGDADLAAVKLSGLYFAETPDGFARLIAGSLDLEVLAETPDRIVLRRRR